MALIYDEKYLERVPLKQGYVDDKEVIRVNKCRCVCWLLTILFFFYMLDCYDNKRP
tara:strand:+ start:371 stop:538 length:168 start_codon:yes stop_codon:yes gene_type:complete